ncbi:MAG: hypothetical protein Q7J68_08170 [Thermoplasmata archaeon]|nr:hypothetical protein [Thermoplasmata archaeon]
MDRRYVFKRLTLFFVPIIVSIIFIVMAYLFLPDELWPIWGLLLLSYFISPFGREVLIPLTVIALLELHGTLFMGQDIFMIVVTIVFVDVMCSIFLLWNLDLLKHIPKIGKWIEGLERFGKSRLKRSRWKRMGIFAMLAAYVALPFQGSNGAASTVIGLFAGMKKIRVWVAIWAGSIIGSLTISVLSFTIGQHLFLELFDNVAWKAISLIIAAGIFLYLFGNYYKHKNKVQKTQH